MLHCGNAMGPWQPSHPLLLQLVDVFGWAGHRYVFVVLAMHDAAELIRMPKQRQRCSAVRKLGKLH